MEREDTLDAGWNKKSGAKDTMRARERDTNGDGIRTVMGGGLVRETGLMMGCGWDQARTRGLG